MMNVNVIGFGLMGAQISALLYLLGFNVFVYSRNEVDEKKFLKQLRLLKRGLKNFTEGTYAFYDDIALLPNELTIESVAEDLSLKRDIYKEIRKFNDKAYFSNSSSYTPKEIGEKVNGLHFFNPINLGLVELNLLQDDRDKDIECLINKLESYEFIVVNVNNNRGYIGNYILFHEISSVLKLIEKFGYKDEEIKKVYSKLYAGRDIFVIIDMIGIDVVNKILVNLKEQDKTIYLPKVLQLALDNNVLGRKNRTSIRDILSEV